MSNYFNSQWRLPNEENKNKQSNYSLSFDGTEYVSITDGVLLNSSGYTLSMWFNANSFSSVQVLVFDTSSELKFISIDSATSIRVRDGSSNASSFTVPSMSVNNWYNIIVSVNNGSCKVYLNSTESTTSAKTVNQNWTINGINGYSNTHGGSFNFIGKIDAVAIFNYALSASQITTLYGSSSTGIGNPMSLSPKPVFYAPLGDQDAFNGSNYLVPNSSLKDYVFDFGSNGTSNVALGLNSTLPTSAITLSLWARSVDNSQNYKPIFEAESSISGQDASIFVLILNNGDAAIKIMTDTGFAQNFGVPVGFDDNKWHHIAVTYDGSNIVYYSDGVSASTASLSGTISYNTTTYPRAFIGASPAFIGSYFKGEVSNVQIFNSALPATGSNSIETLYNNGSPLTSMSGFTSLQGWWKLNATATFDGTNWSIPDDSSNSNTGTSSGMSQSSLQQSDLQHTSGFSPYGLQLDGASNFIETGLIDITGNKTISLWINPTATGNNGAILTISQAGASSDNISIGLWESNIQVLMVQNSYKKRSTTTIDANTWYNVVIVKSTNAIDNIYINSSNTTLNNTGSWNANIDSSQSNIGKASFNSGANLQYFNGSISNVSVWNSALTSSQVTEIYSEGVPQNLNNHSAVSSLISWWQLGSNSSFNSNSWTVLDEKGTNNGVSSTNMSEVDIVNGVGYSSNGVSSGMSDNVKGDAPYSTANSLSVNMDVLDRTTDIPN